MNKYTTGIRTGAQSRVQKADNENSKGTDEIYNPRCDTKGKSTRRDKWQHVIQSSKSKRELASGLVTLLRSTAPVLYFVLRTVRHYSMIIERNFCALWPHLKSAQLMLGAVHILCQPKSGVPGPPLPPPSAMVSIWLTPPRQLSSTFALRPFCTNFFYVALFT